MHGSDVKPGERVKNVHFTEDTIAVDLMDGRTIVVPLVVSVIKTVTYRAFCGLV